MATYKTQILQKQYINKNPSHLEYRVIVKIISPAVSDNQPTLIVDNVQ
jgi:hypothetical protein